MVKNDLAATVAIDAGKVRHVKSVRFQPPDHRVLGVEEPAQGPEDRPAIERSVVAHFVRATSRGSRVQTVAAVAVVGQPGGIRRLKENVRTPAIIAHDEDDVARYR